MRKSWRGYGLVVSAGIPALALVGCGGSAGSSEVTPFVGKTYNRMTVPLVGGAPGSLVMTVQKDGSINGDLVMNVTLPGGKDGSVLQIDYHLSGAIKDPTGAFSLDFQNKPYKISGTLPPAPTVSGGNFTVDTNGKTYGPFTFGSASAAH